MISSDIRTLFFTNPWIFWVMLLSNSNMGSLVGTSILFFIIVLLYNFLPKGYTWWGIGLFLLWVGPVLFFLPFLLIFFVLPNSLQGNWNTPIGCGRNEKSGKLECI